MDSSPGPAGGPAPAGEHDSFAIRYPGLAAAADLTGETRQPVTWTGVVFVIDGHAFTEPREVRDYAARRPA